jgi:hypothetical protein
MAKPCTKSPAWAQMGGIVLVSLLTLSSLLFAPVWGLRMLLDKSQNAGSLVVRGPLLSALLLITFDGLIAFGLQGMITAGSIDDMFTLGVPSLLSVSILLVSIAFPLTAFASLCVVYWPRKSGAVSQI